MLKSNFKTILASVLCKIGVDAFYRHINRGRLLIVTYHGVYDSFDKESLPLFTHLHVELFKAHLNFLKKNYSVISLSDLIACLSEGKQWPEKAALITFDDGFENNYKVAYPVLKELGLPATIFLPVDFVGTDKILWFDEFFLLLDSLLKEPSCDSILYDCFGQFPDSFSLENLYSLFVNILKRLPLEERENKLAYLRENVNYKDKKMINQFRILNWDQIKEMSNYGNIEFGVHTATHRIVSEINTRELYEEIVEPKNKMEKIIGSNIISFSFPNGIPDVDFEVEHEKFLDSYGYLCAFSTDEVLNSRDVNAFRFGRIAVGSDVTSDINFFRLNVALNINSIKKNIKLL